MSKIQSPIFNLIPIFIIIFITITTPTNALVPFTRSLWDHLEDPFRILEQTPLPLPRTHLDGLDGPGLALALARADWKETQSAHVITLDVPGMKKENVKIEVEENRVVRVSGERKDEAEAVAAETEVEKWHRMERTRGKFWRQFRMPMNADLEKVKAVLEDGVLRITVPKVAEEKRRQPKVVDIVAERENGGQDVKATKADM